MASAFDYKKEYKDLYLPGEKPSIVDVPEITFIMVDGKGNPNTCEEYKNALEVLYGLSYSVKMSKMSGTQPEGYFEYVIPPLEGLWWGEDGYFDGTNIVDKNKLCWTLMIRQPEFVAPEVFEKAKQALHKKKPELNSATARLAAFTEGLCAQIMHIGSYDNEPATIKVLEQFIVNSGYTNNITAARRHHEIYLNDPRKTAPDKLKTVIRHPIKKV